MREKIGNGWKKTNTLSRRSTECSIEEEEKNFDENNIDSSHMCDFPEEQVLSLWEKDKGNTSHFAFLGGGRSPLLPKVF